MNPDSTIDWVFGRTRIWFLEESLKKSDRPKPRDLVVKLTEAFECGQRFFSCYDDAALQSGMMFLASGDGIGRTLVDESVQIEVRSNFLLAHIGFFRDVIVPRAKDPASGLNEVCLFYWDSLIEYSGQDPSNLRSGPIFWSLHKAMHSIFGLLPSLDSGINRAFTRWFPDLLADGEK